MNERTGLASPPGAPGGSALRRSELLVAIAIALAQAIVLALGVGIAQIGRAEGLFTDSSLIVDVLGAMTTMAFPLVGLVIVSRRPGNTIGWLFLVANLGWAISNTAAAYAECSTLAPTMTGAAAAAWLATWPGALSIAAYVLIVLLFPDGLPLSTRWRRLTWFVIAYGMTDAAMAAFGAGPIQSLLLDGIAMANPLGLGGPLGAAMGDLANGPFQLGMLVLFAVATIGLVLRFRRSRGVEREQMKWLAWAVAITAALWISSVPAMMAYGSLADAPWWVRVWNELSTDSAVVIPIAAGIAITRYRLYDIDRIVSRTVAYGVVTGLLALLFAGLVLALQGLLAPFTAGNGLAVAASTLVVAATFQPLRGRVQRLVDRRFDRSRYDAEAVVGAFVARVRDEVELEALAGEVVRTARRTVAPASAAVWLRSGGEG
jgi:hypothetical protein